MAGENTNDPAFAYQALLQRAKDDPAVLAFWLGGSRGMGRPTQWSDYDCFFIVAEDAYEAFKAELGLEGQYKMDWRPGVDLIAVTLPMFESWLGRDYSFAHLKTLVDKTGRAQSLIDAKGRVPPDEVASLIHDRLDHALNQAYRALKCARDGDPLASRLEAAEGINPFLDAAFALHDGRLRPFFKYLRWELTEHPLDHFAFAPDALLARLQEVLAPGGGAALSALLADTEAAFRAAGHDGVFDGWGRALPWILAGEPVGAP